MATIIYNEDADGNIAQASQEIFPSEELATTSLPDISVSSGSAEAAATTPQTTNGFNKKRAAKTGIALLALIAIVFSAVIYGTNQTGDGGPSNASAPESSTSTNKAIDVEPRKPPPPKIAELKTSAPTKAKVTKQPATKAPKPAPITTAYPTDQGTSRVSTETTGPPTVADRDDTRY
mmetsp:Transcript_681/g.1121  ORF Transcript_681/g.1121 Transcript_681/m.1121 type:complete len:177 (+) Transcript_681:73-603(+)